ncbi:hypothetical protein [Actinomadura sp. NEAU-AAG7]|uniref:hypothetical protein n=1 Tax=Actinomadura sp. NEAU-AAG7 TaxID=2839640 RepID=UPI001BE44510|nr:hypothetical protein [Actinomadura sp. NEAU-AAG7]MBT2207492.1 hypothetical protein [Actinomadura sp. NEAU-AAG7]
MGEFIDAALGFPTVLFSFSLAVVAGYWALVLLGGLGVDLLDAGTDTGAGAGGADGGFGGLLVAGGLDGVPATVAVSSLVSLAWFVSLAGSALLGGIGGTAARVVLSLAVLVVASASAWLGTRLAVLPLRRVFRGGAETSLRDFVGRTCVVRTGRVGPDFGQAEVTAADGTIATVQVRRPAADVPVAGAADGTALTFGSTALIFDFDAAGGFFWVMPYDAAMAPDHPPS